MNTNNDYAVNVEGVEEYKRPVWLKWAATAASLVVLAGGIALTHNLMKRTKTVTPDVAPIAVVTTVTGTVTTTAADDTAVTTAAEDAEVTDEAVYTDTVETTAVTVTETAVPTVPAQENDNAVQPAQTQDTAGADNKEGYAKIAGELTENWDEIFRIQHGWLPTDSNDCLDITYHQMFTDHEGKLTGGDIQKQYFRNTAPYETPEAIIAYLEQYCTGAMARSIKFTDVTDIIENVSGDEYRIISDNIDLPTYIIKDGRLYSARGMIGSNFGGWSDDPIEVLEVDDYSFVAVRRYINSFDSSDHPAMTFNIVDEGDGVWKLSSD